VTAPALRSPWLWATVALWAAASAAFGWVNLARYGIYDPTLFDVAEVANFNWNIRLGREMSGYHLTPVQILVRISTIFPVYFVFIAAFQLVPHLFTLILFGPTVMLSAALPVFLLARRRLGSDPMAFGLAFAFTMHPFAAHGAMLGLIDMMLFPPAFLWALWALDAGRPRAFWAGVVLSNATKTYAVVMGIIAGFVFRQRGVHPDRGRRLAKVCAVWLVVSLGALFVLQSIVGTRIVEPETVYMSDLGDTFAEVAQTILSQPARLGTELWKPGNGYALIAIVLPWLGLPLLAPVWLLPIVPQAYYAFFTGYPETGLTYGALVFSTFATLVALERIATTVKARARWTAALVLAAVVGHWLTPPILGPAPLTAAFSFAHYTPSARDRAADAIVARVDEEDSVLTDTATFSHVWRSRRANYLSHKARPGEYDWVILDTRYVGVYDNPDARFLNGVFRDDLLALLESGDYGVVRFEAGILAIRRGAPTDRNPAAIAAVRKWTPPGA